MNFYKSIFHLLLFHKEKDNKQLLFIENQMQWRTVMKYIPSLMEATLVHGTARYLCQSVPLYSPLNNPCSESKSQKQHSVLRNFKVKNITELLSLIQQLHNFLYLQIILTF